ncbi:MAG: LepB GTPase-activating domain-containing protein [Tatlockia sp.]|nr:LepB GTPase-activating domain-containing protein [Tatlockia sp.]
MVFFKELTKIAGKSGGKNQSEVDGFYKSENGEEFFIKKPEDKKELFTELFAGLLLKEFMARDLIKKDYFSSLICADIIQFDDNSYGLIQPKVAFTELYKIIGTGFRDGSDRDPFTEMLAGPSYYPALTQQGNYFGLSISLMFSLLLGDYSVHSGNVVVLKADSNEPKQFARIDWGAAFRYFGHDENNNDILVPYEYKGLLNLKWFTKGYIDNYKHVAGLFSAIAEKASGLNFDLTDYVLNDIVSSALAKIPADMLDQSTKTALAHYMSIPIFENTSFGPEGDYQALTQILSLFLKSRLHKIAELKDLTDSKMYQSTLPMDSKVFSFESTIPLPEQFDSLLESINEKQKLDFSQIDLINLAEQFNHYTFILAKQAEVYNLWEQGSLTKTNLFASPVNSQTQDYMKIDPLFAKQRESTVLIDLHLLDPKTLKPLGFPYQPLVEAYIKDNELKNPAWMNIKTLLKTANTVITLLEQLKHQPNKNLLDNLKSSLECFQKTKTRLNEYIVNCPIQDKCPNLESANYYPFTNKEIIALNGTELFTICINEMAAGKSSPLVTRIIKNDTLWKRLAQRLEVALTEKQLDHLPEMKFFPQYHQLYLEFMAYNNTFTKITRLDKITESFKNLEKSFKALPKFLQEDAEIKAAFKSAETELPTWETGNRDFLAAASAFTFTEVLWGTGNDSFLSTFANNSNQSPKDPLSKFQELQLVFNNLPRGLKTNFQERYSNLEKMGQYLRCLENYENQKTATNKSIYFPALSKAYANIPENLPYKFKFKEAFERYHQLEVKSQEEILEKNEQIENAKKYLSYLQHYGLQKNIGAKLDLFPPLENAFGRLSQSDRINYEANFTALQRNNKSYEVLLNNNFIFENADAFETNKILLGLQPEFRQAAINDRILWNAINSFKGEKVFSRELLKDLLSLQQFHQEKIVDENAEDFDEKYNSSIERFYQQAIAIRLSTNTPIKQQARAIVDVAHQEFHHRHDTRRFIADVIMVVSAFVGVGLLVMAGRLLMGKTFFFSSAPTNREEELATNWLKNQDELPDDYQENTSLFN